MKKFNKVLSITLVNSITLIRLIGAIILPFIYTKYSIGSTAFIIIILFLTDAIDGFLARKLKVSTFCGSILDGVSDKLLNIIALIILGLEYNILFCSLVIEITIFYTFYSTYRYGGNIQSSKTGKIKTIILDLCVVFSFLLLSLKILITDNHFVLFLVRNTDIIINLFGFIALASCLVALFDYMKKNFDARNNPKCKRIKNSNKYKTKKPFNMILDELFDTEYYLKHKDESILKQLYL